MLLVSFCVLVVMTRTLFLANSDFFWCGAQPIQLSQSDRSEGPSDHCSDQEFTTWQIVVVPSAQRRRPEWFFFGQNHQRDKIQLLAAKFYIRQQTHFLLIIERVGDKVNSIYNLKTL